MILSKLITYILVITFLLYRVSIRVWSHSFNFNVYLLFVFDMKQKQSAPVTLIDHMWMGGTKVLAACDYVGEKLAAALGITTPKYSYEIEQIKKMQKEREKTIEEETNTGGWMQHTLNTQFKHPDKENSIAHQPIVSQNDLQKY